MTEEGSSYNTFQGLGGWDIIIKYNISLNPSLLRRAADIPDQNSFKY
jgi:hypothetical protein